MGYFFSLLFLSKSATSIDLDISEAFLLISGLLLLVGAIGEYLEDHKRLPRWANWPKLTFEIIVAVSLAGEFIAYGGVFVFSRHLQSIDDAEVSSLSAQL